MNFLQAKAKGWRIMAGPFHLDSPEEVLLSRKIILFIRANGGHAEGIETLGFFSLPAISIFRPSLEMETMKQTERRLKMAKLRR